MGLDQQINDFFDFNKSCTFAECEKLRNEFTAALEELKAQGGCYECRKNQVIRKYLSEIMPIIRKK